MSQLLTAIQRQQRSAPDDLGIAEWCASIGITLDPWQLNAMQSESKRIAVLAGRRTGKSFFSGLLALYEALHRANWQVVIISPSLHQSGELLRTIRSLYVTSGSNVDLVGASTSRLAFANNSRIICLPGTEQSSRGYAANRLILDEASRIPDASFYSSMPLLANTRGSVVAISTPWTIRGFFYTEWCSGSDVWQRYQVMAQECPRIPKEFLEEQRKILPAAVYQCEYECQFRAMEGLVFNIEDIEAAFA